MSDSAGDEREAWITYYPESGQLLPGGSLRVPFAERAADGEICDGTVEIAPDDPRFADFLARWQNRDVCLRQRAEEQRRAREERRSGR